METPKTLSSSSSILSAITLKILMTFLLILSFPQLRCQESIVRFYPVVGISAAFFDPKEVNAFIKSDLSSHGITTITTSDIFAYYELHGGLALKIKFVELQGFMEYATAPKWVIVTNADSRTYFFNRTTIGGNADFYIPLGLGKQSLFLGGGVTYNFLKFKGYKASAPGFIAQAGVSLQLGKLNIKPYLGFNYAKASEGFFEMNYSGAEIGVHFSIHRP
jgi:hypothetical protein